jgi:hypothetical protein
MKPFRLTSANRLFRMELERVFSVNKDYRAIRLTCTHVVAERGGVRKCRGTESDPRWGPAVFPSKKDKASVNAYHPWPVEAHYFSGTGL